MHLLQEEGKEEEVLNNEESSNKKKFSNKEELINVQEVDIEEEEMNQGEPYIVKKKVLRRGLLNLKTSVMKELLHLRKSMNHWKQKRRQ